MYTDCCCAPVIVLGALLMASTIILDLIGALLAQGFFLSFHMIDIIQLLAPGVAEILEFNT